MIQSNFLGPVPWNPHLPSISSQAESALPKEGVAVIERSTGRVIAGVAAPSQEEIVEWLQDHPTFEVLRPSGLFHSVFAFFTIPLLKSKLPLNYKLALFILRLTSSSFLLRFILFLVSAMEVGAVGSK